MLSPIFSVFCNERANHCQLMKSRFVFLHFISSKSFGESHILRWSSTVRFENGSSVSISPILKSKKDSDKVHRLISGWNSSIGSCFQSITNWSSASSGFSRCHSRRFSGRREDDKSVTCEWGNYGGLPWKTHKWSIDSKWEYRWVRNGAQSYNW